MIDVALGIEALIPAAEYFGSTLDNTKECFDALNWLDARTKPTWKQIQDAYTALPADIKDPLAARTAQREALLTRLGITAEEAALLLS
jgi:hypothetical protein